MISGQPAEHTQPIVSPQPVDQPDLRPSPQSEDAHIIAGVDVDALVAAVTGCPSVSGMAGNAFSSTTTLLPGRRVAGVRVADGRVRVEVRARWGSTAATVGREIRAAAKPRIAGQHLDIVIADIDDPPSLSTEAVHASGAGTAPDFPPASAQQPALPAARDPIALSGADQPRTLPAGPTDHWSTPSEESQIDE